MTTDVLLLGAFCASWVVCGCVGWVLRGWADDERYRRVIVPEHPALRSAQYRQRPRLRVIEGDAPKVYDWAKTDEWRGA